MTRRVAYVDAPAGCSGDMFLGALVDLGLPLAFLTDLVHRMGLDGVSVRSRTVRRGALAATQVEVCRAGAPIDGRLDRHLDDAHGPGARTLRAVRAILARLGDPDQVPFSRAHAVFEELARAEARVHGAAIESVHFHEVGAADALVDIAGTCLGLHELGIDEVRVSPLPWPCGHVETAHGAMPLPAPATVVLLEGLATVPSEETYEQVTPTGAALARVLSSPGRTPAGFVPRASGCGAGRFEGSRLPNVLRVVVGEVGEPAASGDAVLLETNLDDVTGQVAARALEQALGAGALDAWCTSVTMKKGRPGLVLSVLARPADAAGIEALLFRETPTLGVRRRAVERTELARRHETTQTPWGAVRIKVREGPDGAEGTPEYEDCRALAEAHAVAVQRVVAAAQRAWSAD